MPRATCELRWFLAEVEPTEVWSLIAGATPSTGEERVDAYLVEALAPGRSVKRRGREGRWERKRLVGGPVEVALPGGARGRAQLWRKRVLDQSPPPDAAVVEVCKRRWRSRLLEVVQVGVGDRWCWSIGVARPGRDVAVLTRRAASALSSWDGAGRLTAASSDSYASWLLGLLEAGDLPVHHASRG